VLEALGSEHYEDPVGTLVARNRPRGEEVFGVGSHCDSNRDGGKYDGTMGVVTALEVCRLNEELELELPPQLVSFLEEEGSGFGQMLLGGRIVAQKVSEEELREGFPSWGAARSDPGGAPRRLAGTAAQEAQAPARRPGLQLPLLPQAVAFSRHTAHDPRAPGPGTAALGPVGTAADFRCGGLRQAQRGRRAGAPVSDPSQRSSYPATRQTDRRRA
jgi:hypothetical protein